MVSLDGALRFLHVLGFVFWLGTDVAVFVASRYLLDTSLSSSKRALTNAIISQLDTPVRLARILTLPLGFSLAYRAGFSGFSLTISLLVWLLAAVWILAMIVSIHGRQNRPERLSRQTDRVIRVLIVFGLPLLAFTGEVASVLQYKMLLYAAAVLGGLVIDHHFYKYIAIRDSVTDGNHSLGQREQMRVLLERIYPAVIVIYISISLAAYLGITQ